MSCYWGVFDSVLFGVGSVVDEDSAADDPAASSPSVDTVLFCVFGIGDFKVGEVVIVETCFLVAPVAESIPLRIVSNCFLHEI